MNKITIFKQACHVVLKTSSRYFTFHIILKLKLNASVGSGHSESHLIAFTKFNRVTLQPNQVPQASQSSI